MRDVVDELYLRRSEAAAPPNDRRPRQAARRTEDRQGDDGRSRIVQRLSSPGSGPNHHTKADIFVVDEKTRQPIGRQRLTLTVDVCSRMVTGFYLTMEASSRLSTSVCLLPSVFDKSAWLREREITEPWPVAGPPNAVHVDNDPDFRSRAFKRGMGALPTRQAGARSAAGPTLVPM